MVIGRPVVFAQLIVGDIVFRPVISQSKVVGRVRERVTVLVRIVVVVRIVVRFFRRFLPLIKGRVVEKLCPDPLFQFHGGQLQQLYCQNLLGRQGLYLLLRLGLYLT